MKRRTAFITRINAKAPEHPVIFAPGTEINAEAGLPEWIQLAPFGEWPTRNKEAVQRFNAESADQIISWFNFWPRKLARIAQLNAVKIYVGHPDFAPEEWPERIELGSVVELNADGQGLNGRVAWKDGAEAHLQKHKFPSVAWDCEINGDGTETPMLLWSVGMWHKPNIKTVKPVINACACEDDPETETDKPKEEEPIMLNKIMESLRAAGIVKEGDAEETVLGAIGSLIQSLAWRREEEARVASLAGEVRTALNAAADVDDDKLPGLLIERFNAATADLAELQRKLDDHEAWRTARINAVVTAGIEQGILPKAEEQEITTQLNADFDGTFAKLLAKKVQLNSKPVAPGIGGAKPATVEAQERVTRLNAWMDSYQAEHGCDRAKAWEASQNDPAMKSLHDAMRQADAARAGGGED